MADLLIPGLPGVRAARVSTPRNVFRQASLDFLGGGRAIDGANSRDPGNGTDTNVLRAGLLMGKITSSGLYAPALLDVLGVAAAAGATSLTISAAGAAELIRRVGTTGTFKLTGPAVAGGPIQQETVTYSVVVASTGVITCTAIVNGYIIGSFVQPTDGSQTITSFMPDGFGTLVTDVDNNNITVQYPLLPISGVIQSTQLLPVWPSDSALQQRIVSQLNGAGGGQYVFDHIY